MSVAPAAPFGLSRIGQIAINVHDLPASIAFYRDVLGMKFLFEAPPQLAFFDCGGIRLMLSTPEKPEFDHPASLIYYAVADIKAAAATLAGRGVEFITDPHVVARMPKADLWLADFRDNSGNILVLMSEVPSGER